MVYKYIILVCMLLVFASCGAKQDEGVTKEAAPEREVMQETITWEELLKNGQYKEAIAYYEASGETLELARAHLAYGNAYFAEEEHAQKALSLLEGLEEDFLVLYSIGYAHEIMQKYPEAIEYYKKAQDAHDVDDYNTALALNQIGHVYDLMGNMLDANTYYIMSEDYGFWLVWNLLNRGRYEYRMDNIETAKKYFLFLLKQDIDASLRAELYNNMAVILFWEEEVDIEKIIEYSKKGIQARDSYPNNYFILGLAYLSSDEYVDEQAIENFLKAIELHPNYTGVYQRLGIYYYEKYQYEKALEYFKKQKEVAMNDIIMMMDDRIQMYQMASYDIAQTYALLWEYQLSYEWLTELLANDENWYFHYQLLYDFSQEISPFASMRDDEEYSTKLLKLFESFNNL